MGPRSDMILLHLLFPFISASVIVNKAFQHARILPPKITLEDATKSLQKWATSSAAASSSSAIPNVVKTVDSEGAGSRAADYLIGRWFSTKSLANRACKHGKVAVNGHKVYASKVLSVGDILEIDFTEREAPPAKSAESILLKETETATELHRLVKYTSHILDVRRFPPLHILYEDNDLAVVYKPSGIHSMKWIGTMRKRQFALDDILPLVLLPPEITESDGTNSTDSLKRPLPCHRLDARVSGCLIVAKTQRAMADMSKQFEFRHVEKEYRAILAGNLTDTILKDSEVSMTSIIEWSASSEGVKKGRILDSIDGFDAQTELQILDISPCSVYGALTTVALFPHTGRRHQLRRHCAALGCPIVGDDLYHDAGFLPFRDRQAAIAALSVGKIKSTGASDSDEDEEDESEEVPVIQTSTLNTALTAEIPDETDSDSDSAENQSTDGIRVLAPEGVRRKVGMFLMCTSLQFYHPTNTVSGARAVTPTDAGTGTKVESNENDSKCQDNLDQMGVDEMLSQSVLEQQQQQQQRDQSLLDRIKITVSCEESPRFIRLKEKALKGHEWQLAQKIPE